ncbi:extracellular solute-binding protein [Candidatus Sumerlaeota bacterium]|nr:extracellular solute-binding protein [Candidatus Sumerlaeota bacterium]
MKHLILIAILIIAIWAFLPSHDEKSKETDGKKGQNPQTSSSSEKKYILKVYPDVYLPGTMPFNVGKPLEGIEKVAEEFETLYPDTKIHFVGVPTGLREWLVTQLSTGQAPDILHVNVEDVWQDVHKSWYVPLDEYLDAPNPFVKKGEPGSEKWWDMFKYQSITRGKAAPDGKNYCVCLDMIETAIFYNKDIFKKLGLAPPKDWVEFLDIQEKLQQAGYTPLLMVLPMYADWAVDLIFDQLYYDLLPGIDLMKDPTREEYLQGYLDWDEISFLYQKGFFTKKDKRFCELWRIMKEWRKYANKDIASADINKLFITQKGAMIWNSSFLVHKLARDPEIEFDWGVFYPPPIPSSYNSYCSGHDMCVIGGAAMQLTVTNSAFSDTGDIATSERLKRCIAFLQFLTLPRNADTVVNEISCLLPNIKGVDPHPELLPFDEILHRRYTTTKWIFTFDLKFNEVMTRMLDLYLNDGITYDEFLDWMERNLDSATKSVVYRKKLDLSGMEKNWIESAPERQKIKDLPDAAQ